MKKIAVIVVVLLLVLVVAPWGIGKVAESRVNAGLDKLTETAPYLTIVDREWTRGWFRSEQEVTFELFGAMLKGAVPEAKIEKTADTGPVETPPAETPPAETPPASAASPFTHPLRFTVRNEILHGPVLWPASLGIARVNTRIVMSDEIRRQIVEFFGTDEPMRVSTRIGFFGGATTRVSGDGRDIKLKDKTGTLHYEPFKFDVGYSKNLDSIDVDGSWPGLEAGDSAKGEQFRFKGMTLTGHSKRVRGDLYDGETKFLIDEILVTGADKSETSVKDLRYEVTSSTKDDFMGVALKVGSGKVRNKALEQMQFNLDEVHYDFSMNRLHAPTLQKLMEDMKKVYTQPIVDASTVQQAVMAPLKQHAAELLKYDPEFVIDRIGVVTPEGQGNIKGVVRLKGVTADDFETGSTALVGKIDADINIDIAQKLIEKVPNGATGAGMAVDQGFAKRDGDKLLSHIEFRQGALKVNGKDVPLPGAGAKPQE